ncbi:MAG: integrase core domain-containing protein [Candidatus Tyrphobacter sp.]
MWSEEHDVELPFIQPGKPTRNAFIEPFNGRVCSELLHAHWFHTLADAQANGHVWMQGYNTTHAHSALGYSASFAHFNAGSTRKMLRMARLSFTPL